MGMACGDLHGRARHLGAWVKAYENWRGTAGILASLTSSHLRTSCHPQTPKVALPPDAYLCSVHMDHCTLIYSMQGHEVDDYKARIASLERDQKRKAAEVTHLQTLLEAGMARQGM